MSQVVSALLALLVITQTAAILAQTTQFTHQGALTDNGNPANGAYNLQFKLFTALSGGIQRGWTVALEDMAAVAGIFKVTLGQHRRYRRAATATDSATAAASATTAPSDKRPSAQTAQ